MNMRVLTLSLSLLLLPGMGFSETDAGLAARADERAEKISDASKFIIEIQNTMSMARKGDYGKLKRGDLEKLIAAQTKIENLLRGHERATDLEPADRIALYNAQELITSTLRSDEKNRKICKRAPSTGSRLTKTECMTVAQREARARAARDLSEQIQRNICNPSEGRPCG